MSRLGGKTREFICRGRDERSGAVQDHHHGSTTRPHPKSMGIVGEKPDHRTRIVCVKKPVVCRQLTCWREVLGVNEATGTRVVNKCLHHDW